MTNKTFLTREGIEKLQADIQYIKSIEIKECIEAITEARDKGDLSENAEYDAAKEKYESTNVKLNKLTDLLSNAVIIDESAIKDDVVQILTTVFLKNRTTNKEIKYKIVPHVEVDLRNGKISVNSPVAQSLIGKSKGDCVIVNTPSGDLDLQILDIKI
jgi:transcription elongation factor GreA